jgi:hypothetical protein
MRSALTAMLLLCAAGTVLAGGGRRHGAETDLFVDVPLEAPSPGVVFPFGGSHHAVPGVVAVNRPPYVCTPHRRTFRERADFVTHLRRVHGLDDAALKERVIVTDGQVHYVGD